MKKYKQPSTFVEVLEMPSIMDSLVPSPGGNPNMQYDPNNGGYNGGNDV